MIRTVALLSLLLISVSACDSSQSPLSPEGPSLSSEGTLPQPDFSVACERLTCTFTDQSTAGSAPIIEWYYDYGNGWGTNEPGGVATYPQSGYYTASLAVLDADGNTSSTVYKTFAVREAAVLLEGGLMKHKGEVYAQLNWFHFLSEYADIFRNGQKIATVYAGYPTYNDRNLKRGTYAYQMCESGTDVCTNVVTLER